ncbi:hypothetical protein APASM_0103 [Actinosynnema pretiosum subsp. pretiosum]|nr:hypothetical protein APASM_0103 [Actinosynnema pretiosum subsp. pretiosum]
MVTRLRISHQRGKPILAASVAELDAAIDLISGDSARQECPSMVEITIEEDPYGHAYIDAGIGVEQGFVHLNGPDTYRTTVGDPNAAGTVLYDYCGNGEDVPAREEVPLATVHAVLAAFLTHDGLIPDDHPDLHLSPTG